MYARRVCCHAFWCASQVAALLHFRPSGWLSPHGRQLQSLKRRLEPSLDFILKVAHEPFG